MSYRFKGKESIAEAVRRIAAEQLDEALEHAKAKTSIDDAVHDTRVCFKKLRGLIRLIRGELGNQIYQRENRFYRDINRVLSKVRDSTALIEIFDKLTERFEEELANDAFESFRKSISRATRERQTEKRKALIDVRKKIAAARRRLRKWPALSDKYSSVSPGLRRTYKNGRDGFEKAESKPSVRAFHQWRKEAKYLAYNIQLLRPMWAGQLKDFGGEIKTLVDYLSDDHDLALLRKRALKESKAADDGHEYEALLALIDKRRAELETRARFLGQRIYAETPGAFRNRFHEYWRGWRDEEKTRAIAAT